MNIESMCAKSYCSFAVDEATPPGGSPAVLPVSKYMVPPRLLPRLKGTPDTGRNAACSSAPFSPTCRSRCPRLGRRRQRVHGRLRGRLREGRPLEVLPPRP